MASLIETFGLGRLGVDDRLRLIEELWESLESEMARILLTEAQGGELDRRVAILDADPGAVTPWETIEARAMARLDRG